MGVLGEVTNKPFTFQGGFARCYELVDPDTKEVLAGKIVSKALLVKQHQKEKMTQEITIHRELHHKHIVGFSSFFEDSDNVYIVLELCRKRVRASAVLLEGAGEKLVACL